MLPGSATPRPPRDALTPIAILLAPSELLTGCPCPAPAPIVIVLANAK